MPMCWLFVSQCLDRAFCCVPAPTRLSPDSDPNANPMHVISPPGLRVEDVVRAPAVVADFRKVIRQDPRIIHKLHRRVFVDKLTRDQVSCHGA